MNEFPVAVGFDVLSVIADLRLIAGRLFLAVGGNAGISGYPAQLL